MIASRGVVRSNTKPQYPVKASQNTEKKSFVIKSRNNVVGQSPQVGTKGTPGYKEYPSVPVNSYGLTSQTQQTAPKPAPIQKPVEEPKDLIALARQTNGFSKPAHTSTTTRPENDRKEMQALLARKRELEERKSELDRLIEEEDQKNVALSNVIGLHSGNQRQNREKQYIKSGSSR